MKAIYIVLQIATLLSFNALSAQINSKSKVHQPSGYTAPIDLQLFELTTGSGNVNSLPVSNAGIAVKNRYRQFNRFPSHFEQGWHSVYVVAESSNNIPTHCYEGLAYVAKVDSEMFVITLKIANQDFDFEHSSEITKGKTSILWKCGTPVNGNATYCTFDLYFIKDLETYNTVSTSTSSSNTIPLTRQNNQSGGSHQIPQYGRDEFYDGYQIVDFAKEVSFKPKNYKWQEWETAVITVFASDRNSSANSRQINIDAMYLCSKQSDVMYRRYCELYGYIDRSNFSKYCRLFTILVKTDELKR